MNILVYKRKNEKIKKYPYENRINSLRIIFFLVTLLFITTLAVGSREQKEKESVTNIICEIEKLESDRDPKCHATATRLENFIYGTKLSPETRFLKVDLQKKRLLHLWQNVSNAVAAAGTERSISVLKIFQISLP
jgi:hypothetical protein